MTELDGTDLVDATDLYGEEMLTPSEFLCARQRNGKPLGADEIFRETWLWLKERGCERLVNPRLIESYAQAFARFIQCEEAMSQYGLIGKHPTTGWAIASPFVKMGLTNPNSRRLLRSLLICSGECVRALLAYGTSLSIGTSFISDVVLFK